MMPTSHLPSKIAMLREESATTSLQTFHNSLRQLGQFGGRVGGGGVVGVVGLLTVRGRGEVKHRESPESTTGAPNEDIVQNHLT